MATSGYTNVAVTEWDTLQFSWSRQGYSVPNNDTTVYWELKLIASTYGYIYSIPLRAWAVNVNGIDYSGSVSVAINNNQTRVLASGMTVIPHDADGSKTFSYSFSQVFNIDFNGWVGTIYGSGTGTLDSIPRQADILSAPNLKDTENPVITYSNPAGTAVESLQACIVYYTDKEHVIAGYRPIDPTVGRYEFPLTESEKNNLYAATADSKEPLKVTFYVTTVIGGITYYSVLDRTATIVDADPIIDSTNVLALGRGNTVISGHNYIELSMVSRGVKGAYIKRETVTCGAYSTNIENDYGVLENVESGTFIFTVEDSRGNTTSVPVEKDFIPYIKPTCNIDVDMDIVEDSKALAKLNINGEAYGGVMSNETANPNKLSVSYRWKDSTGEYCEWITVADQESFDSYSYDITIPDLNDSTTYTFEARIFDDVYPESSPVLSVEYSVRAAPVFDWGEDDFAFNVPVTIQGKKAVTTGMKDRLVKVLTHNYVNGYAAQSLIRFNRDVITDTGTIAWDKANDNIRNDSIATFAENGYITIQKDITALFNIHVCCHNTGTQNRSWIRLLSITSDWKYAESIVYGSYTTATISIILNLTAGTVLGVQTLEPLNMNNSGFTGSYIEIIEL